MNSIAASSHTARAPAARSVQNSSQNTPQGTGAKSLAALLLAAVVAAMVVVADQLVDTWADGHVFVVWVFWWAMVFAATMVFAGTARRMAQRTMGMLNRWSHEAAQRRAEARMWAIAKTDPRVMGELMAAQQRSDDVSTDNTAPRVAEMQIPDGVTALQLARAQLAAKGRPMYYI